MQPATNIEELMSFEMPIELAFVQMLKNAGIINTYPSRSMETAETPWVEVSLITGDAKRHGKIFRVGYEQQGIASPDVWDADLVVSINTQRNSNGPLHKSFIGKVRDRMRLQRILEAWDADSWYRITWIEGGASKKESDDDRNLDITEMTYKLMFNIHPGAWPGN